MKKSILIGLILAGSSLLFSTSCSNSSNDEMHHDDMNMHHDDGKHAHSTQYYCPMKCEGDKTYEEPGSCPVCGMDLVEEE